jgi:ABC-type oligopeptide transport system substrate-binding subunit
MADDTIYTWLLQIITNQKTQLRYDVTQINIRKYPAKLIMFPLQDIIQGFPLNEDFPQDKLPAVFSKTQDTKLNTKEINQYIYNFEQGCPRKMYTICNN